MSFPGLEPSDLVRDVQEAHVGLQEILAVRAAGAERAIRDDDREVLGAIARARSAQAELNAWFADQQRP